MLKTMKTNPIVPHSVNSLINILERTPKVLKQYLINLDKEWLYNNEGGDSWSPYQIIGHLIYGEKTDWMVRAKTILGNSANKTFEPFDRFAQLEEDQSIPVKHLLKKFKQLRKTNLDELRHLNISDQNYSKKAIHPELGEVNLGQLLSTWVVHDLNHIAQISRVISHQLRDEVGPWKTYLGILK